MSTLQEQLHREVTKRGKKSPVAQALRNQIAAEANRQSFQNLYVTGAVKRPDQDKQVPDKAK